MEQSLRKIKLLGEGAFGKCYLCECTDDNSLRVVKQISVARMSAEEKKEALNEAQLMRAFDHPNIIHFHDVYTTTNGKLNIVMDYADGGDLHSKIQSQKPRLFSEQQILDWFVQICLALKHVHDRKVLHRDIKAQNIFLTSNNVIKLGDFGIAKVLSNTMDNARTVVGTPYYLSPEIVESKPYNFKSDVWSLGVLLYEMCTLKPPFDASSLHFLALKIVRGAYPPIPPHYTRDLKTLVAQMLSTDSNRRPTIAQILRMPFIKQRIQNLLTETVRAQEFSHTVLHNQDIFSGKKEPAKKEPKKEPRREEVKREVKRDAKRDVKRDVKKEVKKESKKETKKINISQKNEFDPSKEERTKQRNEERAKMREDIRKRAKEVRKNEEFTVEWIGTEREQMIQELNDACNPDDSINESTSTKKGLAWDIPVVEEVIDRVDVLGNDDDEPEEAKVETIPVVEEDSTHSRLETLRMYLEKELGVDTFIKAYQVLKEFLHDQQEDWDYDICAHKMRDILVSQREKEFMPLIHTLIFLEEHSDN